MRALALVALAALAATPSRASAASTSIVLVPLTSVGSEASKKTLRLVSAAIGNEVRKLKRYSLVPPATVARQLKANKKPGFAACDGDSTCLAALGRLVGGKLIVYGEVGGLGGSQVVYLKLVDATDARVKGSTTLELNRSKADSTTVAAAVIRLLAPERYRGTLKLNLDVRGATVYVDGERMQGKAEAPKRLEVGSHALRVTHPEFRDFVRFVDVQFGRTTAIRANMQQFPIVASEIRKNPSDERAAPLLITTGGAPAETPWYRRWYTVAGFGAAAVITSAVVFALIADGIDADASQSVDAPEF